MLVKKHKAHDCGLAWSEEKKNMEAPDYMWNNQNYVQHNVYVVYIFVHTDAFKAYKHTFTSATSSFSAR